jgi:hypothetical protein
VGLTGLIGDLGQLSLDFRQSERPQVPEHRSSSSSRTSPAGNPVQHVSMFCVLTHNPCTI